MTISCAAKVLRVECWKGDETGWHSSTPRYDPLVCTMVMKALPWKYELHKKEGAHVSSPCYCSFGQEKVTEGKYFLRWTPWLRMKVAIWSLAIPSLTIIPDILQTFNMTYLPNPALLKHKALSQSVRVCKKNAPQLIFLWVSSGALERV